MQIAILGPLAVRERDCDITVPGQRVRRLLERLAVDAPRTVSVGELVHAVWHEDDDVGTTAGSDSLTGAPSNVTNALQSLVSRLRRALGEADRVQQRPGGYALDVPADSVDAHAFEVAAADGRAALRAQAWGRAIDRLDAALQLWRGTPLVDSGDADFARTLRVRWEETRLDAIADRVEADLRLGRAADRLSELEELATTFPLRERFTGQLMVALADLGRQAEALAAYERLRSYLAEELGVDPSPALQEQHLGLLRGGHEPSAPLPQTNLPAAVTRFLGRDDELGSVAALLAGSRLVTIVGPGGSGKTRLAVESAATVMTTGTTAEAWLVELASVTEATNLVGAFLSALGLRETHMLERPSERVPRDDTDRLLDVLHDSDVLLVVDNCEHLVDPVAALVGSLLAKCPHLQVLATSREPLGIAGEALCQLAPLGLPSDVSEVTGADAARAYPAVELFAERAADAAPGFTVTDENVEAVVGIARRLDGLPLAIELAAARLRVLPLEEIARRLGDRFALLTSGSRTALPRHRTLRAVVDWSWELMSDDERMLAMRLAVFPAGAGVEAATAVSGDLGIDEPRVADLLDALVDKSWIRREPGFPLRYRMLETMREYGVEKLAERAQLTSVRDCHARFFADLVARTDPLLRGSGQIAALELLNAERDNITAAMRFLGDSGDARATLDMAVGLAWYWVIMSSRSEPVTWLSFALRVPGETDRVPRILAEVMLAVSSLDPESTLTTEPGIPAVVDPVRRIGELNAELQEVDPTDHPIAPLMKTVVAMFADDGERLPVVVEEALTSSDPWLRACTRMLHANIAENTGDVASMRADVDQAVKEFAEIGDRWGLASILSVRGRLLTLDGDLGGAVEALEESQRYLLELGAHGDEQMAQVRLADVQLRMGDVEAARERAHRVLELAERSGSSIHTTIARTVLAGVELEAGDEAAARRWTSTLRSELGDFPPLHPMRGHGLAIALSALACVEMVFGNPDDAVPLLADAYPAAVGTKDLPILAGVGVSLAEYVARRRDPLAAAELLGATGVLRGADDWTDLGVRRVVSVLRDMPRADFETAYAAGRELNQDQARARLDPATL